MNTINVGAYVVRDGSSVDIEATVARFRSDLASYVAQRETEQGSIADAINSIFDKNLGASLTMPLLGQYVLTELNVQPENFNALSLRVLSYVRENSKGDQSLFVITKGKGGGVQRRSDMPVKAAQ